MRGNVVPIRNMGGFKPEGSSPLAPGHLRFILANQHRDKQIGTDRFSSWRDSVGCDTSPSWRQPRRAVTLASDAVSAIPTSQWTT
jgi:hypothetical protein